VNYLARRIEKLEGLAAANVPAQSVFSSMTPENQGLVHRYLELGQTDDYESAEFRAYRRYMFAVAKREAELGIVPSADEIMQIMRARRGEGETNRRERVNLNLQKRLIVEFVRADPEGVTVQE
jgi:hypothetical protein